MHLPADLEDVRTLYFEMKRRMSVNRWETRRDQRDCTAVLLQESLQDRDVVEPFAARCLCCFEQRATAPWLLAVTRDFDELSLKSTQPCLFRHLPSLMRSILLVRPRANKSIVDESKDTRDEQTIVQEMQKARREERAIVPIRYLWPVYWLQRLMLYRLH